MTLPVWNNDGTVKKRVLHNVKVKEEKEIATEKVVTDEFGKIEQVKRMMMTKEQEEEKQEQNSEQ